MSHPTVVQLIEAVQAFLMEAEGALDGRLRFHARVAGNALAIVGRELKLAPDAAEAAAFDELGGVKGVCEGLREGRLAPDDPAVLKPLRDAVLLRLAVDNPRYATFARLSARQVE